MVVWLSLRTHKTKVASSNPARVVNEDTYGEEGKGKPPHRIQFHRIGNSEPRLWLLLLSKSRCDVVLR